MAGWGMYRDTPWPAGWSARGGPLTRLAGKSASSCVLSRIYWVPVPCQGCPGGTRGKEPACQCRRHKRHGFDPWIGKIPWRRVWQPTLVFLPGESHGQRSLVGYIQSIGSQRVGHSWRDLARITCQAVFWVLMLTLQRRILWTECLQSPSHQFLCWSPSPPHPGGYIWMWCL